MSRGLRVALVLFAMAAAMPATASAELELVAAKRFSPRLLELTFRTANLPAETGVQVRLPNGYEPGTPRRYPVVYLLHGSGGDHTTWAVKGDLENIARDFPAIFVMPQGGDDGGFYVDWYNEGTFGPPAWERYHIDELLPWVDAHFPTLGTRAGRAVAGLSAGGYGTMHYAARHPDRFVAAAAFSPAVDTTDPLMLGQNQAKYMAGMGNDAYGSAVTNMVYRRGHNPLDLAANLGGLHLALRTGNGLPGNPPAGRPDPVEADVHQQATRFHHRLTELGIEHVWDDYGPGAHQWSFWQRDLRLTLEDLRRVFAEPPAPPAKVRYRSIDQSYSVYGWNVALTRPVREFSELADADRRGFTLCGSGSAAVTVPPQTFAPGARVVARVAGDERELVADGAGRVTVPVPLGPPNLHDEFSLEAAVAGTDVHEVRVELDEEQT